MNEYKSDMNCAKRIETWRTRRTKPYDRDKIVNIYPQCANCTPRQRKQIVEYAKSIFIARYLIIGLRIPKKYAHFATYLRGEFFMGGGERMPE